jgi:hypothetical protein
METICQCEGCYNTRLGTSQQCTLKKNENQPNNIWVSFKHSGEISTVSSTEPKNIKYDNYGRLWVKMTPS